MTSCTVCQAPDTSIYRHGVRSIYSQKNYDINNCSECNHFFTAPAPTSDELNDIYNNKYSYDAHSLIEDEKRMRAKNYADYIARLDNVKTALEVGCMHGLLLAELKDRGLKVSGVELDPEAVEYCQKQGLNVVQSSIEDHLETASDEHDVIIMSHVIEHIADPRKQLEGLRQRMPSHGKLVLITPNSMARTRRLFGRYWGYWQVPVHINHFNEQSITKLLKESGFEVIKTRNYGGDSLFFLSSVANLLGVSNNTQKLSDPKKALVKIATKVLRPWYSIGDEDMLVVAQKEHSRK